jgi:hypothetical protein
VGVAFSVKLDKSSLGMSIFVGSGVLTGTIGVILSVDAATSMVGCDTFTAEVNCLVPNAVE